MVPGQSPPDTRLLGVAIHKPATLKAALSVQREKGEKGTAGMNVLAPASQCGYLSSVVTKRLEFPKVQRKE